MSETVADPPDPSCYLLFFGPGIEESQSVGPDPSSRRARDIHGRFAMGSSGNPRGRPRGIPNPRQRVPNLVARPLSAQALADLIDRKPHLLRPLAAQLLPPPMGSTNPAKRPVGCARSRTSGRRCPRFWRPLRAARARPPWPRASRGERVPASARSGARTPRWRRRNEWRVSLPLHPPYYLLYNDPVRTG
jgi:hypothetical protein